MAVKGVHPLKEVFGVTHEQLDSAVIDYLLRSFIPENAAIRNEFLSTFSEYFFSQYPKLSHYNIHRILVGGEIQGEEVSGLLSEIGVKSKRTQAFQRSAIQSLKLLLKLTNPLTYPGAERFISEILRLNPNVIQKMLLKDHYERPDTEDQNGIKLLLKYFKRYRNEVDLGIPADEDNEYKVEKPRKKPNFNRKHSICHCMNLLIKKEVLKAPPEVPLASGLCSCFGGKPPKTPVLLIKGAKAAPRLFKRTLAEIYQEAEKDPSLLEEDVPIILSRCANFILAHGMSTVGIFRRPGSSKEVDSLKFAFERNQIPDFEEINVEMHTVTSLIKQWLREMPDPLFCYDRYDDWVRCTDRNTADFNEDQLNRMLIVLKSMPEENRKVIKYLFTFLWKISIHHQKHKMTPQNLAMVFAPNIVRSASENYEQIFNDTKVVNAILKHFITKRVVFWPEVQDEEAEAAAKQEENVEAELPQGWMECFTGLGERYYQNIYTRKVQWDRPTEAAAPKKNEKVITREVKSRGHGVQKALMLTSLQHLQNLKNDLAQVQQQIQQTQDQLDKQKAAGAGGADTQAVSNIAQPQIQQQNLAMGQNPLGQTPMDQQQNFLQMQQMGQNQMQMGQNMNLLPMIDLFQPVSLGLPDYGMGANMAGLFGGMPMQQQQDFSQLFTQQPNQFPATDFTAPIGNPGLMDLNALFVTPQQQQQ